MSTYEYKKKNFSTLSLLIRHGKGDEYKAKAKALGLSLSRLVQVAVESYGGEGVATVAPVKPAPVITSEQRKILDAVDSLPPDARRALMKFLHALQQSVDEKPPVD